MAEEETVEITAQRQLNLHTFTASDNYYAKHRPMPGGPCGKMGFPNSGSNNKQCRGKSEL